LELLRMYGPVPNNDELLWRRIIKLKCIGCEKTEDDIILIATPVLLYFKNIALNTDIIYNHETEECLCLGCIGYEFDKYLSAYGEREI